MFFCIKRFSLYHTVYTPHTYEQQQQGASKSPVSLTVMIVMDIEKSYNCVSWGAFKSRGLA